MVKKKEFAILFKRIVQDDKEIFVPFYILEGRYSSKYSVFIDGNGNRYEHISSQSDSEYVFGFRRSIEELMQDMVHAVDKDILKQAYYTMFSKYSFYRNLTDDYKIYMYDNENDEIAIYKDEDALMNYKQYEADMINSIFEDTKNNIFGQDEAINLLISTINENNNYRDLKRKNIVLSGEKKLGKTELVKELAKNFNIPLIRINLLKLINTPSEDAIISEILTQLFSYSQDVSKIDKGIILYEGIDKIINMDIDLETKYLLMKNIESAITGIINKESLSYQRLDNDIEDENNDIFSMIDISRFTNILEKNEEENIKKNGLGFGNTNGINNKTSELSSDFIQEFYMNIKLKKLSREELLDFIEDENSEFQKKIDILYDRGIEISNLDRLKELILDNSKNIIDIIKLTNKVFSVMMFKVFSNPNITSIIIDDNIINDPECFIIKSEGKKLVRSKE